MTIRTQQSQIPDIGRPVLKAAAPSIAGAWLDLGGRVDVVDIQRANVIEPAMNTLPAKRGYQVQFSLPVSGMFVNGRAILVPICLLAFGRTIANIARFSALLTGAVAGPSVSKITLLATILPGAIPNSVGMHRHKLAAASAGDGDGFVSHAGSVTHNPKYFDIAIELRSISDTPKLKGATPVAVPSEKRTSDDPRAA